MLNFHNIEFIKSVFDVKNCPKDKKEIVLIGRSNVGKSSLINALGNNCKLAKISSKPGKTASLNYFLVDKKVYIVDTPGYGFSLKKYCFSFMNDFFKKNIKNIKGIIFILDSRRVLSINDKIFYNNFLIEKKIPFFVVLSKSDKSTNIEKKKLIIDIKNNFPVIQKNEFFFVSIKEKKTLNPIKKQINFFLN